jgi:hypothetical protein
MTALATSLPEFLSEIRAALLEEAENGDALLSRLEACQIATCRYDATVAAGYIYLKRPFNPQFVSSQFESGASPHAETLALAKPRANIDVGLDGNPTGIEFLGRPDVVDKLRQCGLLPPSIRAEHSSVTPREALKRAFWMIKLPSTACLLTPLFAYILASRLGWVPGRGPAGFKWAGPAFFIAFVGGWLIWSIQVPKWRLWAFGVVDNIAELKRLAVARQIIWPEGSVFERTEIASQRTRERIRELELLNSRRHSVKATLESASEMLTRNLIEAWHAATATVSRSLIAEAEKEIGNDHPLYGMISDALAASSASDHVLFELKDGRAATVHLTWSRTREPSPWPRHTMFANIDEWRNTLVKPAGDTINEAVDVFYSADCTRRVAIFRRRDGLYGYEEQSLYESEVAERWTRLYSGASLYATLGIARREVMFNVQWLAHQQHTQL